MMLSRLVYTRLRFITTDLRSGNNLTNLRKADYFPDKKRSIPISSNKKPGRLFPVFLGYPYPLVNKVISAFCFFLRTADSLLIFIINIFYATCVENAG